MKKLLILISAVVISFGISACNGGSKDGAAPSPSPEASATATPEATPDTETDTTEGDIALENPEGDVDLLNAEIKFTFTDPEGYTKEQPAPSAITFTKGDGIDPNTTSNIIVMAYLDAEGVKEFQEGIKEENIEELAKELMQDEDLSGVVMNKKQVAGVDAIELSMEIPANAELNMPAVKTLMCYIPVEDTMNTVTIISSADNYEPLKADYDKIIESIVLK